MTTTGGDYYDPDGPLPQNSPMLEAIRPKLRPSPSPQPGFPLPKVSASPSPGRKSSNRRRKVPASQGDAVLIYHLDGGKRPEIAAEAGREPLAEYVGGDEDSYSSGSGSNSDEEVEPMMMSPMVSPSHRPAEATPPAAIDLKSMAALAFAKVSGASPQSADESQRIDEELGSPEMPELAPPTTVASPPEQSPQQPPPPPQWDTDFQKPVLKAPITPYTPNYHPPEYYSPRQYAPSQVLRHPEIRSPAGAQAGHGELPPIQTFSPKPDLNGSAILPSIRQTLGDQLETPNRLVHQQFPHSPPGGASRMSIMPVGHASPPISPNNIYSQSMPSPAQSLGSMRSPYAYYPSGNFRPDYSSSSNTETPNTNSDSASTPATVTSISDRMSIDNMTNPQTFRCQFPGCSAVSFATQYLLNSHANVHSSARPHYCSVQGCPRAEGGRGFKRKNEMIRHGLVHDSPGYVCPFCPDREHKYPRPDNLQRHVRVHHVDKDKDDPKLRDVLAQRPDGPSRGRRRRGAP